MNKKRFFIVTCIYSQYAIMQEGNTVKRDLSTNINKIIILMKILLRITLGLLFLTLPFSLFSENKIKDPTIRVLNFQELHPLLQLENDTIYVMNFWATWCAMHQRNSIFRTVKPEISRQKLEGTYGKPRFSRPITN